MIRLFPSPDLAIARPSSRVGGRLLDSRLLLPVIRVLPLLRLLCGGLCRLWVLTVVWLTDLTPSDTADALPCFLFHLSVMIAGIKYFRSLYTTCYVRAQIQYGGFRILVLSSVN